MGSWPGMWVGKWVGKWALGGFICRPVRVGIDEWVVDAQAGKCVSKCQPHASRRVGCRERRAGWW